MRIAQVAPLYESVPPKLYGGTERVVSYLTEELVRQGHDVTLFATGDSQTSAKLRPVVEKGLRLTRHIEDPLVYHYLLLETLFTSIEEDTFDLVHYHIDFLHFPFSRRYRRQAQITTLHGRLDLKESSDIFNEYREMPLVSISNAQRCPLPGANWRATVYHGIPASHYSCNPDRGKYLAFLGRIAPEKRVDRAIEIAHQFGMPLKIAAKVAQSDQDYYHNRIKPLFNSSSVDYLGEISDHEKKDFLANAYALLLPIDWPEPFGLVVIESMACGTPVVAFNRGAIPEIIDKGVTGYAVNSVPEAVEALALVEKIDRFRCRERCMTRFSSERMANDYIAVYDGLLNLKTSKSERARLVG